jgi:hypothetical protein
MGNASRIRNQEGISKEQRMSSRPVIWAGYRRDIARI